MQTEPSRAVIALGGLTGVVLALLGILLGASVANLTGGEHSEGHETAVEAVDH